jgi:predicted DNA-binding transcriptional regulator YafY
MSRSGRLLSLLQALRGRSRPVTAAWLAEELEVSERTIYRDVADLVA